MKRSFIPDYIPTNTCEKEIETAAGNSIDEIIHDFKGMVFYPFEFPLDKYRSRKEFCVLSWMREGYPEYICQASDLVKKKRVTLMKYKELTSKNEEMENLLYELKILRTVDHQNVLHFYELATSEMTKVFLVYEPCACFLSDIIKKEVKEFYKLPIIKSIMLQLLEALKCIHKHSVMHRNIQPNSIAFTETGILKVCCFQNARWLGSDDYSVHTDDCRYQPPELLLHSESCSTSVDIWSAATILVHLLSEKPLFKKGEPNDILTEMLSLCGFTTLYDWPDFFKLPQKVMLEYHRGNMHFNNSLKLHLTAVEHPQNEISMTLLKNMFNLDSKKRLTASQCIGNTFFSERPLACGLGELAHGVNIATGRRQRIEH